MLEWYEGPRVISSGYAAEREVLAKMKNDLRKRKVTRRRLAVLRFFLGRSGLGWRR